MTNTAVRVSSELNALRKQAKAYGISNTHLMSLYQVVLKIYVAKRTHNEDAIEWLKELTSEKNSDRLIGIANEIMNSESTPEMESLEGGKSSEKVSETEHIEEGIKVDLPSSPVEIPVTSDGVAPTESYHVGENVAYNAEKGLFLDAEVLKVTPKYLLLKLNDGSEKWAMAKRVRHMVEH